MDEQIEIEANENNENSEEFVDTNDDSELQNNIQEQEDEKCEKLLQLPMARVKYIMKQDPDVQLTSAETVFLITKATELFIENLTKEAYTHTAQSKKKTMQRKDIDLAIESVDCLAFLEGALE